MKKLWILLTALIMAFALTACAEKTEEKADKKEAAGPTEEEVKEKKKALVKFYNGLVENINAADADLNSYEGADAPEPEQKAKASESAATVANAVKDITVPEELKDQKADIESALKDISDSYLAMADELKKDAPSLDAAYETFKKGEEKIGKIHEDNKMFKPSLSTSVN
jgi:hypothetical protein